jgi:FkbM family methyltransferase
MFSQAPAGTFTASLTTLFKKGVRYSTVIDVGCADGHFYLSHDQVGLFPKAVALNIDANPLYESSLKAIKEVMGGHYFIGAVTDHEGDIEMTTSAHPYWSSIRPNDDPYWQRVNQLHESKIKVPAVTLDALAERLQLAPPFLLKLDVQGAEVQALRGAEKVLRETDVVVCEADLDDFHAINGAIVDAGFDLFDVTGMSRLPDNTLGWFYPVYLNRRLDHIKRRAFWDDAQNAAVIKLQIDRRNEILKQNANMLAHYRMFGRPS